MSYLESPTTENLETIASYVGPDAAQVPVAFNNFEVRWETTNQLQIRCISGVEYIQWYKVGIFNAGSGSGVSAQNFRLTQNWANFGSLQVSGAEQNEVVFSRDRVESDLYWSCYFWHPGPGKIAISVQRCAPLAPIPADGIATNSLTSNFVQITSNVNGSIDSIALTALNGAVELHRVTGGDGATINVFNGITYPVAQGWLPEILGISCSVINPGYLGNGARFRVNAAGNWELAADLVNVIESWKFDLAFTKMNPGSITSFGSFS